MVAVGNTLEYLDAVVQAFGGAVGFLELPGVVDLQTPTVDALSQLGDLGYGRNSVLVDPINQGSSLVNVCRFIAEDMEVLNGAIGFHQLRETVGKHGQHGLAFGIAGGKAVLGRGFVQQKRLHRIVKELIPFKVSAGIRLALQAQTNIGQSFIEALDDVEHVDTDVCLREDLAGNGNEAVMHIAAEIFHMLAFIGRKLPEVVFDRFSRDLWKNIHDIALLTITVDDVAMETIRVPALLIGLLLAGIALEFINAEGFGQVFWPIKGNGIKDMLYNGGGKAQHSGDASQRVCAH